MSDENLEIKVETSSPKTGEINTTYKYSAISDEHQHELKDDEDEHSNSDDQLQSLNQLYEDGVLLMFLQQVMRESSHLLNDTIPSNVIQFCGEYIGDPEQIKLETELNANFKLLEYNNMKHEKDKTGCIHGCRQTQHIKSWILTVLLLVIMFWGLTCDASSYSVKTCNISFWYDYWWLFIFCLLYICYVIEFILSSTNHYLYNMYDINQFKQYLETIRLWSPRVWLEFKCIDSKQIGKSKHFVYSKWKDVSDNISDLYLNDNNGNEYANQLIKLKIDRFVLCKDAETAKICKNELDNYISSEIQGKGEYFDISNGVDKHWAINDDDNKKNVLLQIGAKSFEISFWFYFIVSCTLCSTCYRIWFSSLTTQRRYKVIKEISL